MISNKEKYLKAIYHDQLYDQIHYLRLSLQKQIRLPFSTKSKNNTNKLKMPELPSKYRESLQRERKHLQVSTHDWSSLECQSFLLKQNHESNMSYSLHSYSKKSQQMNRSVNTKPEKKIQKCKEHPQKEEIFNHQIDPYVNVSKWTINDESISTD